MARKKRKNVKDDRLSSLPDDLIHKILSLIGIKHAVQTSVLSSKWRFIWTKMSSLSFSTEDFVMLFTFSKFVEHVLSHRNNQMEVSSVELSFNGKASPRFVKKILKYAFSHNVQQLTVRCLHEKSIYFPFYLFISRSLKHLTLVGSNTCSINAISTWDLPSLTSLHLEYVIFCDDITDKSIGLFSKCANLKNLTLISCHKKTSPDRVDPNSYIMYMSVLEIPTLTTLYLFGITLCDDNIDKGVGLFSKCANLKNLTLDCFEAMESNCSSISHPRLSNLTLKSAFWNVEVVNVVAPQLRNLTISNYKAELVISAPHLASLNYTGSRPLRLSTDGFHSLEKADICIPSLDGNMLQIVCLLQQLHSVKFLTLNTEIVKRLSSTIDLISHQPSPFANLKRLKIYPEIISVRERPMEDVIIPTEVKNYFLDSSPSATLTLVTNKDITALKNAKLARNLMGELQVLLQQYKNDTDTATSHLDQGETPMESQIAELNAQLEANMHWRFGGRMTQIEKYWEDLNEQMLQGKEKTTPIISLTRKIKGLMTNLPPLQKENLEAIFSSLCAEADIIMKKIIEFTKIQFD